MALVKKMNESAFAQILKEFHALGELIRARQDEKQAILDQFDSESKRFYFGKISEKALESSIKKTNKELNRLDREINQAISRANKLGSRMSSLIKSQKPKVFKATLSGISSRVDKKKVKRKKVAKKKVARRKKKK
jgi:predicted RND superfamily exporter protein